ncbi:MAG: pyridoxal phosphate-dependent aminotransferase [Chloracidobacterium sp.]|uniref:Aminotransferase n=1 Tax=Chloracidobacterium validum TaxID=2821543 RepID=A0ABX8B6Y3_9BACT|nr:pyridoxal phosphate-dependent aminotransferase [Chloracidobacterium validum]QUW02727.1 pyridoxal phosphate-dependent aminotransferase [Chloracidobacterium validum]
MVTFRRALRLDHMQSSSTMAATAAAARLRAQGHAVIDLGAGEPDFDTPENIRQAAIQALNEGKTRYTPASGTTELKQAIADYIAHETGTRYPLSSVIVSAGGKQTLFNALVSILNPGDEVIIPAPYWVTFPEIVAFCGGVSVFIPTHEHGFQLTADMIERVLTPRTKVVIVNSPSNPSGVVIAPDAIRQIAELCAARDLWLISDECYYKFVYPPARPFSAASLPPELRERVLVSGSLSKTYAMTGWRIGYALAHPDWIAEMTKVQSHSTSNPTTFAQWAAIEALRGSQASVATMLAEYQARRDWIVPALAALPGARCRQPEGAFYAFPDVSGVLERAGIRDVDFAQRLLEEAHVVVTAGSAFGADGYLRISYANSLENIRRGIENIHALIKRLG